MKQQVAHSVPAASLTKPTSRRSETRLLSVRLRLLSGCRVPGAVLGQCSPHLGELGVSATGRALTMSTPSRRALSARVALPERMSEARTQRGPTEGGTCVEKGEGFT